MDLEFIKSQIAKIIGITPRSVAYYTDEIPITPEVAIPKRRGANRKYSAYNLLEFGLIKDWTDTRLPLAVIKKLLEQIKYSRDRGQGWLMDLLNKQEPRQRAYAMVYDAFSDDMEVTFKMIDAGATDKVLTDAAGKVTTTIDSILRRKNGKRQVTIIDLSADIKRVIEGLPI